MPVYTQSYEEENVNIAIRPGAVKIAIHLCVNKLKSKYQMEAHSCFSGMSARLAFLKSPLSGSNVNMGESVLKRVVLQHGEV